MNLLLHELTKVNITASAADLAARPYVKAPPPVAAAIYDWSGFYIGINGGGGSAAIAELTFMSDIGSAADGARRITG